MVFNLIKAANAEGWIKDLVDRASQYNPGNLLLKAIATELLADNPTPGTSNNIKTQNEQYNTVTPPELQMFQFEVVTVNARGQEVKRDINKARYFIEDLGNGINLEMVKIPNGKFMMGTEDEEIERLVQKFERDEFNSVVVENGACDRESQEKIKI